MRLWRLENTKYTCLRIQYVFGNDKTTLLDYLAFSGWIMGL